MTAIVTTNKSGEKAHGIHGGNRRPRFEFPPAKPNKKAQAKLAARIKAWEATDPAKRGTKPGSLNRGNR